MNSTIYENNDNHYNFPSYRRNPITSIAKKQDEIFKTEQYEEEHEEQSPVIESLPVFNLVSVPNENNTYRIDTRDIEKRAKELEQTIKEHEETISKQHSKMRENDAIIHTQIQAITNGSNQIQTNQAYLQNQINIYNHNVAILQQQSQQIYTIYAEIARLQEQQYYQEVQVKTNEDKLKDLESQVAGYEEQVNYHQNMMGAFNTLLQNPEYFTQLMMSAIASSPNMTQYPT